MIKQITLVVLTVLCLAFTFKKDKKFIPPGTTQISETFYADQMEISNFSWLEYEHWTKTKYGSNSAEHIATLPDTLVWRERLSYCEPYTQHYYRHPAYKEYPVIGVSYEQVLAFCKWRTERVKEFYSIKYRKNINIEYRLPTKQEWELISNNGTHIFSSKGKNEKGYFLVNCKLPIDTTKKSPFYQADVTAPIKSYSKNYFGLYNMIGNVAEMVAEKGISKGGSWWHKLEECRPGKDITYDKPTSWLGFRCVCDVKP